MSGVCVCEAAIGAAEGGQAAAADRKEKWKGEGEDRQLTAAECQPSALASVTPVSDAACCVAASPLRE